MQKNFRIYGMLLAITSVAMLAACSDDNTTNNYDKTAIDSYSEKSLPDCTKENEGVLAFVKTDNTLRVCYDTEWYVLNGKKGIPGDPGTPGAPGQQGEQGNTGTGCTVSTLKDSTGLKLVCDGDSIGVIKNGPQGDPGNPGSDCEPCTTKDLDDGSGYKIICGGDSVAVIRNGNFINGTNSTSNTSGKTPIVSNNSSSSEEESFEEDNSSSSEEEPIEEDKPSSSHFSTTYDKNTLPLNFGKLLNFFTVDQYRQSYVKSESGNYYNHTWNMTYGTGDAPGLPGGVIETINSAAEGTNVLHGTYGPNPPGVFQQYTDDFIYSIEILYEETDDGHFYELELVHREYVND